MTARLAIAPPALLLLPLLAAAAPTQNDADDGPVLAIAHTFSIDGSSSIPGAGTGTLLFTRSEFSSAPPPGWTPTPPRPDFSTVLGGLALDLDGFSVGYDYIQSTATGLALIPPGNWAAITFSVTRTTAGTPGGRIATEAASPDGAAADVFFYVLPGSSLPPELVDRTMRNQDSTEINADAPGVPGNLDAHDIYASLIFNENPQLIPTLPFVSVFFTVTSAAVPSVPAAWWGGAPPSGATILRRDWVGGAWTPPYPFLTPTDLGLVPLEDVDALAVDLIRGHVLFSTTRPAATPGAPLRDPVLYHRLGSPGNFTYRTIAGQPPTAVPVSDRLGLDPSGGIDDVDGICALDPGPGGQPRLDRVIGTPVNVRLLPTAPTQLGVSVIRRRQQVGTQEQFVSHMTGWPTPNTPMPGLAFTLLTVGMPTNPYVTAAVQARNPTPPFQGDPRQFVWHIPSNPAYLGAPLFFVWAAVDQAGGLDVSFPVRIVL